MTKLHWRMGSDRSHIGVEVLPEGKPINVTISRIEFRKSEKINGKTKDVWVAYFKDDPFGLPMALNTTNRKSLVKAAKTNYLEELKDFPVTLYSEKCRDPEGGGMTDGLRLKPQTGAQSGPQQKVYMDKNSEQYPKAKNAIIEGKTTVEKIMTVYNLSPDIIVEFNDIQSKRQDTK